MSSGTSRPPPVLSMAMLVITRGDQSCAREQQPHYGLVEVPVFAEIIHPDPLTKEIKGEGLDEYVGIVLSEMQAGLLRGYNFFGPSLVAGGSGLATATKRPHEFNQPCMSLRRPTSRSFLKKFLSSDTFW